MTAPSSPLLRVEGLVKHFPAGGWPRPRVVHAVDDVSFWLDRGESDLPHRQFSKFSQLHW